METKQLRIADAAQALGVSYYLAHKMVLTGRLSATRGLKGQWEVDPASLARLVKELNSWKA